MTILASWFFLVGWFLLVIDPIVVESAGRRRSVADQKRSIKVINESKVRVDVLWVNPQTQERVSNTVDAEGILYGADINIDSYVGHTFEILELEPKTKTKTAGSGCLGPNQTCRRATFTVNPNEDQVFKVNANYEIEIEDSHSRALQKATEVMERCQRILQPSEEQSMEDQINAYADCMNQQLEISLTQSQEAIEFETSVRKQMGQKLVHYACQPEQPPKIVDGTLVVPEAFPATECIQSQALPGVPGGITVDTLFDSDETRIFVFQNLLLSPRRTATSSCDSLLSSLTSVRESDATTTNVVPWSTTMGANQNVETLRFFNNQLYAAVSTVLDWQELDFMTQQRLQIQEGLPLFHVFTSNTNPTTTSTNESTIRQRGNLIGQLLLFCDVPTKGGSIHFPELGVHVNPKPNEALLITYRDPNTSFLSDNGLVNEHVQCPVYDGKLIYLQHDLLFQNEQ